MFVFSVLFSTIKHSHVVFIEWGQIPDQYFSSALLSFYRSLTRALLRGMPPSYTLIKLRFPFTYIITFCFVTATLWCGKAFYQNVCLFQCVHSVVAVDCMCLIRLLGGGRWKPTPVRSEAVDHSHAEIWPTANCDLELWNFQNCWMNAQEIAALFPERKRFFQHVVVLSTMCLKKKKHKQKEKPNHI